MGTYLNPGNSGFTRIVNSDYVDKTGMIALINQTIDTTRNLICVSRPRRFGKSYAAQMLCAYYDKTVDSKELFSNYKIAKTPDFDEYINHYDVIYLDMTQILNESDKDHFIDYIKTSITEEIQKSYPEVEISDTLSTTLINTVEYTGNKFVAIIDEWDAPIRITSRQEQLWLDFLRMLFKSSGTTARIFAAAYMTGILPIKKDSSQSALSDFWEYTIFNPLEYSEYVGFTEDEVLGLCKAYGRDFSNKIGRAHV